MKLLFDQNISPRIVALMADLYPESTHVREHHLQDADDETVWEFAKQNSFIIVSKDSDFHQKSFLLGFPPKVIWMRSGNCTTQDLMDILRKRKNDIEKFVNDKAASFLALS